MIIMIFPVITLAATTNGIAICGMPFLESPDVTTIGAIAVRAI